jgi:hypothetical protein
LQFPVNYSQRYPFQLKEVFDNLQYEDLKKVDLLEFLRGNLYSEKIINIFFKILEKMNLV